MTTQTNGNRELDYRAVLVRKETKEQLRRLRAGLQDRDLFQERRLATAAVELAMEAAARDVDALGRLLQRAREVVVRDIRSQEDAEAEASDRVN